MNSLFVVYLGSKKFTGKTSTGNVVLSDMREPKNNDDVRDIEDIICTAEKFNNCVLLNWKYL